MLAIDHRGHGRGIRTRARFRLADCADDAAALIDELGTGPVIAVGYSMGGPVAQLLWHRHRDDGVRPRALRHDRPVLVRHPRGPGVARRAQTMARMARLTPDVVLIRLSRRVLSARVVDGPLSGWVRNEVARGNPRMLLEAGTAIGRYDARPWIGTIDVPTAVVLTEHDSVVPPGRQRRLAAAIPGAEVFPVAGDHSVCATDATRSCPRCSARCTRSPGAAAPRHLRQSVELVAAAATRSP